MLTHKNNTALFGLLMLLLLTIYFFIGSFPSFLFIIPIAIYFGIIAYGSSRISSNYHLTAICSSSRNSKNEIALTFDDGPDSALTPLVLEVLKKHEIKATFFCIGKKIAGNEALLQCISDEGHILANHSYSHSYFFDFFSADKIAAEVAKTNSLIETIIHKKPLLFRPPYGVTTPNIASAIEKLQLTTIGWNVRSMDGVKKNEAKIIERVNSQLKSGSIVLFHDTHPAIKKILEETIENAKQKGLKIVPLNQLIPVNPYA